MTARRRARGHLPATGGPGGSGGVPAAFLVGRCLEVWAEPKADNPAASAVRRFAVARRWWLVAAHVDKPTDQDALIPLGTPWSVDYLIESRGQYVAELLAPAEATPEDLPRLAAQADDLFLVATGGDRPTSRRRRT